MQGRTPARAQRPEATHHHSCPGLRPDRRRRPHAVVAGAGRARHRRRPDPGRPAVPRGRAGLGAVQRRQARAHGPQAGPRLAEGRPGAPGRAPRRRRRTRSRTPSCASTRARASPPSARSSSPTTRRHVPRPALDDVGVQRPAVAALRRLRHRGQGARHPAPGHREARRRGRRDREAARRARRRRSTTSSPRPRTCSTTSRPRSARTISVRAAPSAAPPRRPALRRPGLRPRRRRGRGTRWPRSATPTCTAPPARAPSTAPA